MGVQEVDAIGMQSPERAFYLLTDGSCGQSSDVFEVGMTRQWARANFRRQGDSVPCTWASTGKPLAEDRLRLVAVSAGPEGVVVGGVPERGSDVVGCIQAPRRHIRRDRGPEVHGSE